MKKILILIALIGCFTTGYSQLNENAQTLKEKLPESYEEIKKFAAQKWEGDHEMMVHTINKQADAKFEVFEILKAPNYDEDILRAAIDKWEEVVDGEKLHDYVMIVHTYNKQIKAKESY